MTSVTQSPAIMRKKESLQYLGDSMKSTDIQSAKQNEGLRKALEAAYQK